MTSLVITGFE